MEKPIPNTLSLPKRKSTMRGSIFLQSHVKNIITTETIIDSLSKPTADRTKPEEENIISFLIKNFSYFSEFTNDLFKLNKLVNVLEIETYKPNEAIINFGEQANKFYVLLRGIVSIYKPIFIEKEMSIRDFRKYASDVKHYSPKVKYERLKEMNSFLSLDIDYIIKSKEYQQHQSKFIFFIEEQEKVNEMSQGFAFGEVALITRATRNATIAAQTECALASISKANYNKIIKECEEKRFEKKLTQFKSKYSFFSCWTHNQLLGLFNCFTRLELMKGQFLYSQSSDPDGIYILESGDIEMFSLISYDWINSLYEYIIDSKTNLVYFLYNQYHNTQQSLKVFELLKLIEQLKAKAVKWPCQYDPNKNKHILISSPKKDTLIDIKHEEENYKDPFHLVKVLIKKGSNADVFGFVECIEMKKRLCSIKVTSSSAIFQKVNLIAFYKLINSIEEDETWRFILDLIAKTKFHFNRQLQNQVKHKTEFIGDLLDFKYESALSFSNKIDPSIAKLCGKIKGFGRYDKDSVYYNSNAKKDDNRNKDNNDNETNSQMNRKLKKRNESMPSLFIQNRVSSSSNKCKSNKEAKKNNSFIFNLFQTKPFRLQTTSGGNLTIRTKTKKNNNNNNESEKINKEPSSAFRVISKKHQHHITFSNSVIANIGDKASTMSTIQQTSRTNRMASLCNDPNSTRNHSKSVFAKHLFLSKDYIDYINNQFHKSKSPLKNSN